MAEVIGGPPSPRTALFWDGTRWGCAIVDAAGRIRVRGEDQLFSLRGVVAKIVSTAVSGADGYIESPAVPANRFWVITTIVAHSRDRAVTRIHFNSHHDGVGYYLASWFEAIGVEDERYWSGHTVLDAGDTIRAYFTGVLAADRARLWITGYEMTLET